MANVFTGDANCVALYRFESGALTTDSKSTNTLTNNNTVEESTGDYKEGSCCADFERDNLETFTRTDANLASGFPLKSGETNANISVCFWFKAEASVATNYCVAKHAANNGDRSFAVLHTTYSKIQIYQGHTSGTTVQLSTASAATTDGQWYHVGVTYNNADYSYRIRIWDNTNSVNFSDVSDNFSQEITIGDAAFSIGGIGAACFDGLMDEVVVFNDVLTAGEIDQIRAGTYGASVQSPIPIFMQQMNHFNGGSLNGPTY